MVSLAGGKNARARKVRTAGACVHSAPRLARITLTSYSGEAQLPSGAQGTSRSAHHHLFAESRPLHGFFTSRVESKEMRAGSVSVRRHFRSASGTDSTILETVALALSRNSRAFHQQFSLPK